MRTKRFLTATTALLLSGMLAQAQGAATRSNAGQVLGNTYQNQFFGFTYQIPPGWSVMESQLPSGVRLTEKPPMDLLMVSHNSDSAMRILAEDVRNTAVRSGKDAINKIVKFLGSTPEKHLLAGPVRELTIQGMPFFRADYSQTIGSRTNYFCTLLTMSKGFVLRFSVIARSSDQRNQVCSSVESIRFAASQ